MTSDILQKIHFVTARLRSEATTSQPDIASTIPIVDSQRQVSLAFPGFLQVARSLGSYWPAFCKAAHSAGIAVMCPAADLDALSTAQVPVRMSCRANQEPLLAEDVNTSDVIELRLRSASGHAAIPAEVERLEHMAGFLNAVRLAAGENAPVGLRIPLDTAPADLKLLAECKPDFITLETEAEFIGEFEVWAITRAMRVVSGKSASTPLWFDGALRSGSDICKCLALGAQAVALDFYLRPLLERALLQSQEAESSLGRLSNLGVATDDSLREQWLSEFSDVLNQLAQRLRNSLSKCGVESLAEFGPHCLSASDPKLAKLLNIAALDEL